MEAAAHKSSRLVELLALLAQRVCLALRQPGLRKF
jgi:hypothetical protein